MPDEMQQLLCDLVREHGAEKLVQDAAWCRGVLNQHVYERYLKKDQLLAARLREVNLLVSAVECGGAAELYASPPHAALTALRTNLSATLCAHHGVDKQEAQWIITTWTTALDRLPGGSGVAPTPKVTPPRAAVPASEMPRSPMKLKPCPEATTALIWAIVGIFTGCFAVITISMAISKAQNALQQIAADAQLGGEGQARAALTIAYLHMVILAIVLITKMVNGCQ